MFFASGWGMDTSAALRFLLASRQRELTELQELSATVHLVEAVAVAVHALQRERGLSTLHWGRETVAAHQVLSEQRAHTDAARRQLHAALERLDPGADGWSLRQGSRLYAALAQAFQADDACDALRRWVPTGPLALARGLDRRARIAQVTGAYGRMVSRWIAVIQEAADIAVDADVSRHLVSLFQLIQAKEWMGQERAQGSALFAQGHAVPDDVLALQALEEAQSRALEGFLQFAPPALREAGAVWEQPPGWSRRELLRRSLQAAQAHGALNPASSELWFAACTDCMESLRAVETQLLDALRQECRDKAQRLERELQAFRAWVDQDPSARRPTSAEALADLLGGTAPPPERPNLPGLSGLPVLASAGPQTLALVHAQALRVQRLSADLDAARAALHERKVIERAKGLWMQETGDSEEVAYRTLRRLAMDRGVRLMDVAEEMLRRTKDGRLDSERTALGQ